MSSADAGGRYVRRDRILDLIRVRSNLLQGGTEIAGSVAEPGVHGDRGRLRRWTPLIDFEIAGGEFTFGCVTGAFTGGGDNAAVEFSWNGNDEMDEACGSGWAEIQADGSLQGQIGLHAGDEIPFIARGWPSSSTAC